MIEQFLTPGSIEEAVRMKSKSSTACGYLSGGTEIHRLNSPCNPDQVIYIKPLLSDSARLHDGSLTIGAGASIQQIIDSGLLSDDQASMLRKAAPSRTLRNMATVGGNIAARRDDSYLLPFLLAYKASILTADVDEEGEYEEEMLPLKEYIEHKENYADTLIREVSVPLSGRFVIMDRFSRSSQGKTALLTAFGADIDKKTGQISEIRAYISGSGLGAARVEELERFIQQGDGGETQLKSLISTLPIGESRSSSETSAAGSIEYRKRLLVFSVLQFLKKMNEQVREA